MSEIVDYVTVRDFINALLGINPDEALSVEVRETEAFLDGDSFRWAFSLDDALHASSEYEAYPNYWRLLRGSFTVRDLVNTLLAYKPDEYVGFVNGSIYVGGITADSFYYNANAAVWKATRND